MARSRFTPIEAEVVILYAVWELIDGMVHYGHFMGDHRTVDAQLTFKNAPSRDVFLILLTDFLSVRESGPFALPPLMGAGSLKRTQLGYLAHIAANPILGSKGDAIGAPTLAFATWLDGKSHLDDVWLPTIDTKLNMDVERRTFLKVSGVIRKHNLTSLDWAARTIRRVLEENGVSVSDEESYLLFGEFQQWFMDHLFAYHSTSIAAYLNNIRWGIYAYLRPEFERSFRPKPNHPLGIADWSFDVPTSVNNPLARALYWGLMNRSIQPPHFPRFTVTPSLANQF